MTLYELIPLIIEDCMVEILIDKIDFPRAQLIYEGNIEDIYTLSKDIINNYPIESIDTSCFCPRRGEPAHVWRSYMIITLDGDKLTFE